MPKTISPENTISKEQARRFLVSHHRLAPPRKLSGKEGILDYVRHVNCIQYDPINVVGNNSHLVLQSRVRNYKPAMLNELLYEDRRLLDGFDKVMSIYPIEDWPAFARPRQYYANEYKKFVPAKAAIQLTNWVRSELKERGTLSSLDLEEDTRMTWWLSGSARAVRIALDALFAGGDVVVHHRVGTRRYFDLAERVLPKRLLNRADPNKSLAAHVEWRVLRRVGGLGLAHPTGGESWGGLAGTSGVARQAAVASLVEKGQLVRVKVEGLPKENFYIRRSDLPAMEAAARKPKGKAGAAFIAALDNFMWSRNTIDKLFDFFYRWEVYVPEPKRKWGYYVLPVLYGDSLVGRFDPGYQKAAKTFTIKSWWWEKGVDKKDDAMLAALQECTRGFAKYLGAERVVLGEQARKDKLLRELVRGI